MIDTISLKKITGGNLTIGGNVRAMGTFNYPVLAAGSATAGTAPLKFTSGVSLTTAEAGALEFTTDDFFATITTGAARKAFVLDDGARLTSTKVPVAYTNGRLIDSSFYSDASDNWWVGAGTGLPYGEIYIDNGTSTLLLTTSYVKIETFDTEGTNGVSNNMTPAVASNKITITTAGVYRVSAVLSGKTTKVSPVYMAVFIDGVEQNNLEGSMTGVENGFITVTANGLVSIAANKDIDIRLKYITGADAPTVTLSHINLNAVQVGG